MYPTASAPQYAFGPGLAPVPMPGMAGGGLAALARQYRKGGRIKYFEEGGEGATGGADSSTEGGAGASGVGGVGGGGGGTDPGAGGGGTDPGGGGGNDAGVAAAAAAQGVDNAVAAAQDAAQEAAAEATLGAQVAAEADEAEAENAANTAAALGAQANAIAAEIAAQAEENAKAETMAAAMRGELEGFPGPPQDAPGFSFGFQSPFNMQGKPVSLTNNPVVNDFLTVNTPMGNFGVNALSVAGMGGSKAAQAANAAVGAGKALGFAEGGLAAAQQTQSKGRGQDTMLVHMTPGEVKGLQALAMSQGGSLTINPQTGLPEAGFLSRMLPMIAGMALAPLTAGTSLAFLGATPFASALTVGGLTGLATGSLKKGLMAGLGAYGGAGISQGMSAAAGTAENLAAAAPTTPYNPDLLTTYGPTPGITPTPAITPDISSFTGSAGDFGIPSAPTGPVPGSGYAGSLPSEYPFKTATYGDTGQALDFTSNKNRFFDQLPPPPPTPATGIDAFTGGTKAMLQPGTAGADARSAFMKAAPTGSLMAAGTTLASALTPEPAPLPTSKSFIRGYDLDITNPSGTPQYTPQDTREREQVRYAFSPRPIYEAAQGGTVDPDYNMEVDRNGGFSDAYKEGGLSALAKRRKALAGDKYYKFAQDRKDSSMEAAVEQNFAKGGMKDALPPRFLQGAGDGMSDSIKARIGGVQEARLADGEFVIPADVVSHLGNGSSKAGAKKLYSMMDKIRKARTGRTRQAPEVNPNKYMPA